MVERASSQRHLETSVFFVNARKFVFEKSVSFCNKSALFYMDTEAYSYGQIRASCNNQSRAEERLLF